MIFDKYEARRRTHEFLLEKYKTRKNTNHRCISSLLEAELAYVAECRTRNQSKLSAHKDFPQTHTVKAQ